MPRMVSSAPPHKALEGLARAAGLWLLGWWRVVRFGALMLVLALSPGSYGAGYRTALARHVYLGTAPLLPWFTVLSALISLVLTRIVLVTSLSYGLSRYALEMVVRTLVLELIPLTAALFVAIRVTIPFGAELAAMRRRGDFQALQARGVEPTRAELLPRALAGMFSVATVAALSCIVALVLAYLSVYGFTVGGLAAYTRTFGQIFTPSVTLIFVLKTVFFSFVVALVPLASGLYDAYDRPGGASAELRGLVRMFTLLLLIEMVSLMGNYY